MYQRSQGDRTFEKVMANKSLMMDVLFFGTCGAVGQMFIFLTISLHNCLTLSIMTTCRKCFSMVVSAVMFNHSFSQVQHAGVLLVFSSTIAEVYFGNKRK
jgi:UDP-galactose transporter B1